MKQTELRGMCPRCYRQMIGATDPFGEHVPHDGDLALCASCGGFSVFDFSLRKNTLRRPTSKEALQIGRNANARRLRQRWQMAQRHNDNDVRQ